MAIIPEKKPVIFISHINEEKEIAKALKSFLEDKYLGVDIFASSQEDSLKLGDKWQDRIYESMKGCQLVIILCSPISITRQWVNFEAGAGWIQGIPVIPLCHSGMEPSKLPVPLNSFQAGMLNSVDDARKLFKRISTDLEIREPKIEGDEFFNKISAFETRIENSKLKADIEFVESMLEYDLFRLRTNIILSTPHRIDNFNGLQSKMPALAIEINDIYNLFDYSILSVRNGEFVFEQLNTIIQSIANSLKFIMTYTELILPRSLKELFQKYFNSRDNNAVWYISFKEIEPSEIENKIEQIKNRKPGEKSKDSFDTAVSLYYQTLSFLQNWLYDYEKIISEI